MILFGKPGTASLPGHDHGISIREQPKAEVPNVSSKRDTELNGQERNELHTLWPFSKKGKGLMRKEQSRRR